MNTIATEFPSKAKLDAARGALSSLTPEQLSECLTYARMFAIGHEKTFLPELRIQLLQLKVQRDQIGPLIEALMLLARYGG